MKSLMIKVGNFFFTWRNKLFPLIILGLYAVAPPPHEIMGSESLETAKDILALLIAFAGLLIRAVVIGYAYIKRGGMNKKVYAENLVTEGMFSLCRNPLYLGNIFIYAGVFLMHGNPLVVILGIGLYLFIYQSIIYAEETYLLQKFGDAYHEYCRDVPRWIPRLSHFREATTGMEFNLQRVIIKDYTTIATTIIALAITEGYEYLALPNVSGDTTYITFLAAFILASGLFAAMVRFYKKRIM